MYKKVITYTDFDGEERTEPFYFNLTEAELVELEMRFGGVNKMLKEIQEAEDGYRVTQAIRDIICAAYGEKSSDGRRFMKNKEIFDSFRATEAYSVLFTELLTNETAAAEFVNSIMPPKIREEAAKRAKEQQAEVAAEAK